MNLVLLGPPGSGKGTQAAQLSKDLGIAHISTGDILRESVRKGTELGLKAQACMKSGQLVPDDVIVGIVRERLQKPDCGKGFLLDGFPRTIPQAESLDRVTHLDAVISLEVTNEECVERLSGRRSCPNCGATYHVAFSPPKSAGKCDRCGTALIQREDDKPDTILKRLQVYERQTEPLIQYYQGSGQLVRVNGSLAPEVVYKELKNMIQSRISARR